MRIWRFWLNSFIVASQYNPPSLVELIMLTLAIAMLTVAMITPDKPYFILCLSLSVGAAMSILVREAIAPSPQTKVTQLAAIILLLISFYGLADTLNTLDLIKSKHD
ncbi:hypothetical protein ACQFX9_02245 [Aliinostoc sp. HNIBRCY26]|uniref:hypothetical protein n=1 Tax=Aliinostoc sp. HNIBRCY26 TaxID=3418997 RepID=UPI003D06BB42